MGSPVVLDTHVFVDVAFGLITDKQLRTRIDKSAKLPGMLLIPAITLVEVATLIEKGRIKLARGRSGRASPTIDGWLGGALLAMSATVAPITVAIASLAARLGAQGDPADRLIIATALEHEATLVTRDATILTFAAKAKTLRVLDAR